MSRLRSPLTWAGIDPTLTEKVLVVRSELYYARAGATTGLDRVWPTVIGTGVPGGR